MESDKHLVLQHIRKEIDHLKQIMASDVPEARRQSCARVIATMRAMADEIESRLVRSNDMPPKDPGVSN